jgi:uncharacterized protein
VIYQATFFDGRWMGHADFLLRVDAQTELGDWGYEPADAKLARSVRARAVLQLCSYAEQVGRLQGCRPQHVHVIGGDLVSHPYRLRDYAAYYRRAKAGLENAVLGDPVATYPHPVEHCAICRWRDDCDERRRADDHLSLVAGMRRDQTKKLMAAGVSTLGDLAKTRAKFAVSRIGGPTLARLRHQAQLQAEQRRTGEVTAELVEPIEDGRGLSNLPAPSSGDLFFDMEGDPFAGDEGLEYLFGVTELTEGKPVFHAFWGHDAASERRAFEDFMDLVMTQLAKDPEMHVYHYAPYEPSALKRLAGRHATREDDVDRLLRGGVLVDLYQVVRQGIFVSQESYSIKKLEPLYMATREGAITDAGSSIVAYESWLETADAQTLLDIEAYNRDDCESTWHLRDWLEQRRGDAERAAGAPLSRPAHRSGEPAEAQAADESETEALVRRLTTGIPDDPDDRSPTQAATWLLAQLVGWHRREARPEWWAYYARLGMSDDELVIDAEAIGDLEYEGVIDEVARSLVFRYRFPFEQEHKIGMADTVLDPRTEASCGTVVGLNSAEGTLDLKRATYSTAPHPTAVVPRQPVDTAVVRKALARIAVWVAENSIDAMGPYQAVRDLLLRRPPRFDGVVAGHRLTAPGEGSLDAALRLAGSVDETCLPIQGPPGSGKTWTGARMILDLIGNGRTVGVTAMSHKAIGNLLDAVSRFAAESGRSVRALQKASEDQRCGSAIVECTSDNKVVDQRLAAATVDLVAGTQWLFARPEMQGKLDVLFVDEAGQMSLANTVAMGAAAKSLVLLGDPQQLPQPQQGTHPQGAGASALEHLLGEDATVPADRGLFLDRTWRLHPDICDFISESFYEGRLKPDASCSRQVVAGGEWAGGTGVRWVPVDHDGNRSASPEEATEVARGVKALLGRQWTDQEGNSRPLDLDDILVVAPYNAHVARLRSMLPDGARIGTVDKFQGQEAPVVIFSMATSSAEDLPRALEFLYSLNRVNVAISRAKALAVLVCSPRLLEVRCRTPRQMRLVNAVCRLAEMASPAHL